QRGLKPDHRCVALRAIADPHAHEPMQMTRAHAAARSHVLDSQTTVLTLDLAKRGGDHVVHARVLESSHQKSLEDVDALFRSSWWFRRSQIMKGGNPIQSDPTSH